MNILKLKTNINCKGCLSKVTPFLNGEKGIKEWEVDLQTKEKVLTAKTENFDLAALQLTLTKAGFKSEELA